MHKAGHKIFIAMHPSAVELQLYSCISISHQNTSHNLSRLIECYITKATTLRVNAWLRYLAASLPHSCAAAAATALSSAQQGDLHICKYSLLYVTATAAPWQQSAGLFRSPALHTAASTSLHHQLSRVACTRWGMSCLGAAGTARCSAHWLQSIGAACLSARNAYSKAKTKCTKRKTSAHDSSAKDFQLQNLVVALQAHALSAASAVLLQATKLNQHSMQTSRWS
jgi:hypothetical protein